MVVVHSCHSVVEEDLTGDTYGVVVVVVVHASHSVDEAAVVVGAT